MKVLFVLHSANLNGIFRACLSFARFLKLKKSADVILCCPEEKEPLQQFHAVGIHVLRFDTVEDAIGNLNQLGFRPDYVVRESFFSPDFKQVAAHFGAGYLTRVHDLLPFFERTDGWYTKHLTADEYFSQCAGSNVVFVGKAIQEYYEPLSRKYGVRGNYCYPTIIEEELHGKAPPPEDSPGTMRILQLGTVYRRKGCLETLEAYRSVIKKLPGKIELHFIGDRRSSPLETEYSDRLLARVEDLGFRHQIKVWPSHPAPHFLLPDYDVLTLHSDSECTPLVIFEALYLGKPVVAPRLGSIPEQISENENGYLFERGRIEQQADALARILSQRDRWRKNASHIHELYQERFGAELQNERFLELMVKSDG